MPSQVTVTSKTGPGLTVTSQVLTNIVRMEYLTAPKSVIQFQDSSGKIYDFDCNATTTWTITISAGNITVVVSQ